MKKGVKIILLLVCLFLLASSCYYCINYGAVIVTANDNDFYSDAVSLAEKAKSSIENKTYNSLSLKDDNSFNINNSGIYELSGTYNEVTINIDTKDDVILILNNCNLSNSNTAVINTLNTNSLLIYTTADTENTITSGEIVEISSSQVDESGAAIYSKDNLFLAGEGILNVNGYINNAIVSNDSLLLLSGTYNINAINNGLKAHDYLNIYDGTCNIVSGNDAVKADNDEDTSLGNINIYGGNITINAYGDGISALTNLLIEDGYINIKSPSYSNNTNMSIEPNAITNDGNKMMQDKPTLTNDNQNNGPLQDTNLNNGTNNQFNEMPNNNMSNRNSQPNGNMNKPGNKDNANNEMNIQQNNVDSSNENSNKGLKAGNIITIDGGTINIETSDDCIHSNCDVIINGGDYTLSCSDDGIHADNLLTINDGNIVIENSYEGIEGHQIYINDGSININSSDDGFNASGIVECILEFNGGNIYVNANGDGLDSNGDVIVNGGYIIVDGPTNSGNGSLDSGTENGGSLLVNGGELLAIGAKGMDESFESSSLQCSLHLQTETNYSAGSKIQILNENNEEIFSYNSQKSFSSIIYTSSALQEDSTYYILINDDTYTLTMNDNIASNSNNMNFTNGERNNRFPGNGKR